MTSFPHILCSVEHATLNQCWNFNKEVAKNSENKGQNAYQNYSFRTVFHLFCIIIWMILIGK